MSKSLLSLLPAGLVVDRVSVDADRVAIAAHMRATRAACPLCHRPSARVHSRYSRHLGDLPWQGRVGELHLQVRRFRWTADEVEQVRTLSERLAAAEGNTTLANSWRLRLRTARGLYWMRMDARERITTGAERRADLRAGKEVDAGLVFRNAGLDQFPARVERVAAPEPAGRRRRRTAAEGSSLSERLRAGCHVLSISWNDPSLPAPGGLERDVWGFTTPLDEDARAIMKIFAPETTPGSGWSIGMSVRPRPGPKWSEEAKGRARRRNLRARLDRKVPLFADGFYEDELQRRPDYFAGKDMGSAPVVIETIPQPDPVPLGSPLLGHNNGPPLEP